MTTNVSIKYSNSRPAYNKELSNDCMWIEPNPEIINLLSVTDHSSPSRFNLTDIHFFFKDDIRIDEAHRAIWTETGLCLLSNNSRVVLTPINSMQDYTKIKSITISREVNKPKQ
jgi:hypothetical protein